MKHVCKRILGFPLPKKAVGENTLTLSSQNTCRLLRTFKTRILQSDFALYKFVFSPHKMLAFTFLLPGIGLTHPRGNRCCWWRLAAVTLGYLWPPSGTDIFTCTSHSLSAQLRLYSYILRFRTKAFTADLSHELAALKLLRTWSKLCILALDKCICVSTCILITKSGGPQTSKAQVRNHDTDFAL